jgi:hypothetical protein
VRETDLQHKPSRVPLAKQGGVQQGCGSSVCWENSQEQEVEAEDLCLRCAPGADLLSLNPWDKRINLREESTNWKAGCGKSARPVWREGWRAIAIPTPITTLARFDGTFDYFKDLG